MSNTAWGTISMKMAKTTDKGATFNAAGLETIGTLKEDSISLSTEDGKKYELYGSGHQLIDELRGEPTIKVTATIVNIPEATRKAFWQTEGSLDGSTKQLKVKSMVTVDKFGVQFGSDVTGSETFEAPYCSVNLKPIFAEAEGWSGEVEFTIMRGAADHLFAFGIVE